MRTKSWETADNKFLTQYTFDKEEITMTVEGCDDLCEIEDPYENEDAFHKTYPPTFEGFCQAMEDLKKISEKCDDAELSIRAGKGTTVTMRISENGVFAWTTIDRTEEESTVLKKLRQIKKILEDL